MMANYQAAFDRMEKPELEVMICTYGRDGIRRVASAAHPRTKGVRYLVSWQTDGDYAIPKELEREDFRIFTSTTKGLSINRNIALSHATAPILLISDDDADYTREGLSAVVRGFEEHPDADIIAFRFDSASSQKTYPANSFSLDNPEKGYYISSIEIAFRNDSVKGKIRFNEYFGVGALFPSGEEDIFIKDCLNAGLKGIYLPETITRHDGTTTASRNLSSPSRPQTKGAVFLHLYPGSWPLRMLIHAIREIPPWRKGCTPSPISYCKNWLKGVAKAKKLKVFPTQSHS